MIIVKLLVMSIGQCFHSDIDAQRYLSQRNLIRIKRLDVCNLMFVYVYGLLAQGGSLESPWLARENLTLYLKLVPGSSCSTSNILQFASLSSQCWHMIPKA